jgi:hypothetical protein
MMLSNLPVRQSNLTMRTCGQPYIRSSALADCRNRLLYAPMGRRGETAKKPKNAEHRYKDECIHPSSIARIGLVTAETRGALTSGAAIRD